MQDQRRIAAYHEAGHALAYWRHGYHIVCMQINAEGTGHAWATGPSYYGLALELDESLAGPTAEAIYTGRPVDYDENYIEHTMWEIDCQEPSGWADEEDDLSSAVSAYLRKTPDASPAEIAKAVAESITRCDAALRHYWHAFEKLAAAAYDAEDGLVLVETVDRVFTDANVDRPADFVPL